MKENQYNMFNTGGDSIAGDAPTASDSQGVTDRVKGSTEGEGGSTPTSPLQPKQLRLAVIEHATAKRIWIEFHYLHRDITHPALELGVFSPDMSELVGAIAFSYPVGRFKSAHMIFEISRMWLSDERCARNSESRVLAVSCRMIKKLCPHIGQIVSYSDEQKQGHKGTIYKAAGFRYHGLTQVSGEGAGWKSHPKHNAVDNWPKKRWVLTLFNE